MSAPAKTTEKLQTQQNGGETKRLTPDAVRRSDQVREKAESQAGKRGPGRPKGSGGKPKTPEEAAKAAKAKREAEEKKKAREDEYHEPTDADVRKFRRMLAVANKPLEKMEKAVLLKARAMGCDVVNGEPLITSGDLQLSEEELDFHAECAAGTAALISPAIARYIPVVGLVVGGLGFFVSRGIVIAKCNAVFSEVEQLRAANQKAQDENTVDGKIVPLPK